MNKSVWQFGIGQTAAQERAEIRSAHLAGRGEEYVARQRLARMVEAERERKRKRKARRR